MDRGNHGNKWVKKGLFHLGLQVLTFCLLGDVTIKPLVSDSDSNMTVAGNVHAPHLDQDVLLPLPWLPHYRFHIVI